MKKTLVFLAPGAEEMEVVIVVDVLRRAGLEVCLASLEGMDPVLCSRGIRLCPDAQLSAAGSDFDLMVLPGGASGAQALARSAMVQEYLRRQDRSGRPIGAICAAPIALVAAQVGAGRRMTSHPSVRRQVEGFAVYSESRVTEDGPIITSRGPGTAFEFALALAARLAGPEAAQKIAGPMVLPQ